LIFVVQSCPPRDPAPLIARLEAQGAEVLEVADVGREGQLRGMLRALDLGVRARGGPVTLLEDDVVICDGFVPYVCEHWREPRRPVVRWYAPGHIGPEVAPGWLIEPGAEYLCNQATAMSVDFVRALLAAPETAARLASANPHSGDALIADVLHRGSVDFATHLPGLVQHEGAASLVAPIMNPQRSRLTAGPYHHSLYFIGAGVDARTVRP